FDEADVERTIDTPPDWLDLGPSYTAAVSYTYETLAGYLRKNHDADFVLIVLGDHQPPALVAGEGVSWDVPVHVIARSGPLLDCLKSHGFREGLSPARPSLGHMQDLLPMLIDAFGRTPQGATTPRAE